MDWAELFIALLCLAVCGGVVYLFAKTNLIPDPYRKWVLVAGAAVGTLGVALLVNAFRGKAPAQIPNLEMNPVAPTVVPVTPAAEVVQLTKQAVATDAKIDAIQTEYAVKAEELKDASPKDSSGPDAGGDVGSFLAGRAAATLPDKQG